MTTYELFKTTQNTHTKKQHLDREPLELKRIDTVLLNLSVRSKIMCSAVNASYLMFAQLYTAS